MLGAADKWRTESLPHLLEEMRAVVDPRALPEPWSVPPRSSAPSPSPTLASEIVVLVGHRAAGKSRLLPLLSRWTGLPGFDLDELVAHRTGRSIAAWFGTSGDPPSHAGEGREGGSPAGFRTAEREGFLSIPGPAIVATGGGFLSLHSDLLREHAAVLIPITFETYRARLLADRTRPRLRPELSLEEEIRQVYDERELRHASVPTIPLLEYLRRTAPYLAEPWPPRW